MRQRCSIVKRIILSHLEECYQEQIIDLENPIEILNKLEKLKREEINDTTASITEQLNHMRYEIQRETFVQFFRRFEEVVRKYELVAGESLGEKIKTDALYRAVVHSVPSIKTATYTNRARGSVGFNLDEIKRYVQQHESENKPNSQIKQAGINMVSARDGRPTCTKCGMAGHIAPKCRTPPGYFKCYECQLLVTHKAKDCPNKKGKKKASYISPLKRNYSANIRYYENRRFPYNRNNSSNNRLRYNEYRGFHPNYNNKGYYNNNTEKKSQGNWHHKNCNSNKNFNHQHRNNNNGNFRAKNNNNYNPNNNQNRNQRTTAETRDNNNKNNTSKQNNNSNNNKAKANFTESKPDKNMLACNIKSYIETRTGCYMMKRQDSQVSNTNFDNMYISFIADSGASDHMVNESSILTNMSSVDESIRCANKSAAADIPIIGVGDIYVRTNTKDPATFKLSNVKYSPNVAKNLLLLRKFVDNGFTVILNRKGLKIIDSNMKQNQELLIGKYESPNWIVELPLVDPSNLHNEKIKYVANFVENQNEQKLLETGGADDSDQFEDPDKTFEIVKPSEDSTTELEEDPIQVNPKSLQETLEFEKPKIVVIDTTINEDESNNEEIQNETYEIIKENIVKNEKDSAGMKWHRRLGHASISYLLELQKQYPVLESVVFDDSINQCDICKIAKFTKLPFKELRTRAVRPLQVIHSDVMGPLKPISYPIKNRYIAVFIDDFSRLAQAYAMQSKDETSYYLEKFVDNVRNLIGTDEKVCTLRTDLGTEYTGGYTKDYIEKNKIDHETGPPDTPQHNSVAERFNRTLQMKMRALLFDSGIPHYMGT